MDFYKSLKPFTDFDQIQNSEFFKQDPGDWVVLLTDIKGSTQAAMELKSQMKVKANK